MSDKSFSRACTEVLEILKYLPQNEYSKIPFEKIQFLKNNQDNNYMFLINPAEPLENQNISIEANSIIVSLFRDYFATDDQKIKLDIILKQNEDKYQEELRKKYNPNDIFKNRNVPVSSEVSKTYNTDTLPAEVKNENFFTKFISYIKRLLRIGK